MKATRPLLYSFLTLLCLCDCPRAAERPGRKWSTVQRLERPRLEAVREARQVWAKMRKDSPGIGVYQDYRAVIHVHAEDSDHTGGTREEVLAAAKKTRVQVVLFTDHRGPKPDTWRGLRDGVLFLAGSEDEGEIRFPEKASADGTVNGGLRFLCHIEERYDASSKGFHGMEIYNRHTDVKDDQDFEKWFRDLLADKKRWAEFAALYREFPDEIFGAGTDYWPEIFQKWDQETQVKPFTGVGANDAHQNQVFHGLMLDPYEVSFRNLSTHILARELTENAIRQSLREGHVYVSHDWLCDASGFSFVAANNLGVFTMGDPALASGTTRLIAQTPVPAKIKLFRNGVFKEEQSGERVTFTTKTDGVYRVEAWLTVDGEDRPWIYGNPIYLKAPDLFSIQLPSFETPPTVEVAIDITYLDGPAEHEAKHKLDLYLPKGKTNFPIFLFIHGGAWTSGDRSQYPPVGNRYAREGVGTVIPSYRLAPKSPPPAQIEDAAAALSWVARNMAARGGNTNLIFVGGHSAGAHLASLLALDKQHLARHGLSPALIKGTIALSGPFDVRENVKVFGTNETVKKAASPLFQIHPTAPPFLITYCEWDYFPLALQAREFHDALRKAGVPSTLVFIPKENHISEMLSVSKENDLTVRSVLNFIFGAGAPEAKTSSSEKTGS